ncbi:hypothetical protein EDD21DRAFT_357413 [Dissophora ornata]|nr:hypothetical protein EDD21DRAFT_357413 [Dissophora ornata]
MIPRDASKAHTTKTIVESLRPQPGVDPIDFVFCIGDDCSDEDMITYCNDLNIENEHQIVTCTVELKISEARWSVPEMPTVLQGLQVMAVQDNVERRLQGCSVLREDHSTSDFVLRFVNNSEIVKFTSITICIQGQRGNSAADPRLIRT